MRIRKMIVAAAIGISTLHSGPAFVQEVREARDGLTLEQAGERAERVSDVRYSVELELDAALPEFSGRVTSRFLLRATNGVQSELTVDFTGGTVRELRVNGRSLEPDYNGFFLTLPGGALLAGENSVEIAFAHPNSRDGQGLYRF
jgi:aminopeptidase N